MICIKGKSTQLNATVYIKFNVSFHGDIHDLLPKETSSSKATVKRYIEIKGKVTFKKKKVE